MTREIFGHTKDGNAVHRIPISGGGLTAHILTWGAVIQNLNMDGHQSPLVLGFETFDPYPAESPYFGAIAGRFANRINNGQFELDGETFNTDRNFLGKHTLHGGSAGCGKRLWTVDDVTTNSVTLSIEDPDGWMGFPGKCRLQCRYELRAEGVLRVELTSVCDRPTIANLAHHSYFILDDSPDCRAHMLEIQAGHYLPVNDELIPTGEIRPVENTAFDFQHPKPIGQDIEGDLIYDHNWCLANRRRQMTEVARVSSPLSGIQLSVSSTEPGLQFYAGHKVNTSSPGLTGNSYGPYAGFCLETQNWPDAPNHPDFPNAVLRPDESLRQITEYRFSHIS